MNFLIPQSVRLTKFGVPLVWVRLASCPRSRASRCLMDRLIDRDNHPPEGKPPGMLPPARSAAKELTLNHRPALDHQRVLPQRSGHPYCCRRPEKPPQVILLTSPSPREGKTVTSLNLAIALAEDGHSALLIDGDMRHGMLSRRLGMSNNRGLSNVLTGGLSLAEGITGNAGERLSLLSRGIPPPNPSELLGSRRMKEMLTELRQRL